MNYLLLSDILWYIGHILTGLSIIVTHNNYYLAVSMVLFGQFITIISRPIGRIKDNKIGIILSYMHPKIFSKSNSIKVLPEFNESNIEEKNNKISCLSEV
jgi:hypothetical protein